MSGVCACVSGVCGGRDKLRQEEEGVDMKNTMLRFSFSIGIRFLLAKFGRNFPVELCGGGIDGDGVNG